MYQQLSDRQKKLLVTAFRFKDHAPLKDFIQAVTGSTREVFQLEEILEAMRDVISRERLFDERNPAIIMCSTALELALDQKALHVRQVKGLVLQQLEPIEDQWPDEEPVLQQLEHNDVTGPSPTVITTREEREVYFELKEPLREIFQTMEDFNQSQTAFLYKEVAYFMSGYILKHKDRLFDSRNIWVALVEGDLLETGLGVKAFHRSQIRILLRKQLVPIPDQHELLTNFKTTTSTR